MNRLPVLLHVPHLASEYFFSPSLPSVILNITAELAVHVMGHPCTMSNMWAVFYTPKTLVNLSHIILRGTWSLPPPWRLYSASLSSMLKSCTLLIITFLTVPLSTKGNNLGTGPALETLLTISNKENNLETAFTLETLFSIIFIAITFSRKESI